jgi:hypothetical protein
MYLSRRHVSALAMGHHQVYTNVIRVLYSVCCKLYVIVLAKDNYLYVIVLAKDNYLYVISTCKRQLLIRD